METEFISEWKHCCIEYVIDPKLFCIFTVTQSKSQIFFLYRTLYKVLAVLELTT